MRVMTCLKAELRSWNNAPQGGQCATHGDNRQFFGLRP